MRTLVSLRGMLARWSTFASVAVALSAALVLSVAGLPAAHASAATASVTYASDGVYPANGSGYDVSWPQCTSSTPGSGTVALPTLNGTSTFAIVGVTYGKSYNTNPCLGAEVTWANSAAIPATYYINLNGPNRSTAYRGDTGPDGSCPTHYSTKNYCIAYNYGANAAQYALDAASTQGIAAPAIWWLDIETGNTWSNSTTANDYSIEGAVDVIRAHGGQVGFYSTAYQFGTIAGNAFKPGTLIVRGSTVASTGAEVIPNWIPGYNSCTNTQIYTGGLEWLAQVGSSPIDSDSVCQ